jgi:hypothetical protein
LADDDGCCVVHVGLQQVHHVRQARRELTQQPDCLQQQQAQHDEQWC